MKLINNFKSPNFNIKRNRKISFIIIHYTAIENYRKAIKHLCDPNKKVSSHYLISQAGEIYNLVDEKNRAWHAGISYWDGYTDLNSLSIGIELDYSKNYKNNRYSKKMLESLLLLLKKLKKKHGIHISNILGHSDIAPLRKVDPGKQFPWIRLYNKGLAFNPNKKNKVKIEIIKKWFLKNKIITNKKITIFILNFIGYNTLQFGNSRNSFKKILYAYQSHFLQSNISGKADLTTVDFMIKHFITKVLTKI